MIIFESRCQEIMEIFITIKDDSIVTFKSSLDNWFRTIWLIFNFYISLKFYLYFWFTFRVLTSRNWNLAGCHTSMVLTLWFQSMKMNDLNDYDVHISLSWIGNLYFYSIIFQKWCVGEIIEILSTRSLRWKILCLIFSIHYSQGFQQYSM